MAAMTPTITAPTVPPKVMPPEEALGYSSFPVSAFRPGPLTRVSTGVSPVGSE